MKKKFPLLLPERMFAMEVIAKKVIDDITEEYDISALDFIAIMEHIQRKGLSRFKL